jgi:hypothetical protein
MLLIAIGAIFLVAFIVLLIVFWETPIIVIGDNGELKENKDERKVTH